MTINFKPFQVHVLRVFFLSVLMAACAAPAMAQGQGQGEAEPLAWFWTPQVLPGGVANAYGLHFEPGQQITLFVDGVQLNAKPFVVTDDGRYAGQFNVPEQADVGLLTVSVRADDRKVTQFEVMISKVLPPSGKDEFAIGQSQLPAGLYQVAYSAKNEALFVTRSTWKPTPASQLLKVNPETLDVLDSTTPPASPARNKQEGRSSPPPVYAMFGIATDAAHETVWVTNSVNNTVAVYRQRDLSLLKQFAAGLVPNAHSIVVDTQRNRVYASAFDAGIVAVFDTNTLQLIDKIALKSSKEGRNFNPAGMAMNAAGNTLYVTSVRSAEIAMVDLAAGKLEKVFALPKARRPTAIAWDPASKKLLVASYKSDSLLIVDPDSEQVVDKVYVGARPVSVVRDPVSQLVFVANRGAETVAVVDPATAKLVANLPIGTFPNHVIADGTGNIYVLNKSDGPGDPEGDLITRITPSAN